MSLPRTFVVAGLVLSSTADKLLLSLRRPNQSLGGMWELPGGKVEPGEHPEAALVRELTEELGIEVAVGRIWDVLHHRYPAFELIMMVYACRIVAGEPRAVEVSDWAWCSPAELPEYPILPADQPLVRRLLKEGLAGIAGI